MKHLKVRAELIRVKGFMEYKVKIKLLEQTHLGSQFGNLKVTESISNSAFKYGSVVLLSYHLTSSNTVYYPIGTAGLIYILFKNSSGGLNRNNTIFVSLKEWALVKKAIEAYNEWGSTQ